MRIQTHSSDRKGKKNTNHNSPILFVQKQDSACAVKGSERANELVKAGYVLEHSLGYVYG